MNIKQIAVAVSLIATAWSAMAVEATQWNPPAGQQSRAEVKADLARAVANGEIAQGETYGAFDYAHQVPSNVARADVKTELARARANGEL